MPAGLKSRDRILWAAATMLGEGPGAALSVRAVAERAHVSAGSLRHHFPTQQALMEAMLSRVYDLVMPQDVIRDTSIPPRERLLAVLRGALAPEGTAGLRRAWITSFERYVAIEPTQATRAEYLAIERELRRRVEGAIEALVEEGALAPGETARRARFLMTVVSGVSVEQVMPGGDERLATGIDTLRAAVDSVFDGGL